jgi:hypothetical protein
MKKKKKKKEVKKKRTKKIKTTKIDFNFDPPFLFYFFQTHFRKNNNGNENTFKFRSFLNTFFCT